MLFSLIKHYLDTGTALNVSQSLYCFTTSISHGVENYFPRLWGTDISDAILYRVGEEVDTTLRDKLEHVKTSEKEFQSDNNYEKESFINGYSSTDDVMDKGNSSHELPPGLMCSDLGC